MSLYRQLAGIQVFSGDKFTDANHMAIVLPDVLRRKVMDMNMIYKLLPAVIPGNLHDCLRISALGQNEIKSFPSKQFRDLIVVPL